MNYVFVTRFGMAVALYSVFKTNVGRRDCLDGISTDRIFCGGCGVFFVCEQKQTSVIFCVILWHYIECVSVLSNEKTSVNGCVTENEAV